MDSSNPNEDNSVSGRLSRLEGMFTVFQGSINAQNQQTAQFLVRVENLERRQLEIERCVATRDDFRNLSAKVDKLSDEENQAKGRMAAGQFTATTLGQWAAVVISLCALVGVGLNRQAIDQGQHPPRVRTP